MKDAADSWIGEHLCLREVEKHFYSSPKVIEEHSHTCTFLGEGGGSLYPMLAPLSQPLFSGLSTVDKQLHEAKSQVSFQDVSH